MCLKISGCESLSTKGNQNSQISVDTCTRIISQSIQLLCIPKLCVVLGAIAAIIIAVIVLIIFFAIAGFIIQLLAPVIAGIIILIIIVVGGAWLYAKYRSR